MTVGLPSAILASVVSLTVAIAILFRRPRRPLYNHFAAFTFSLFLWHGASFISRLGGEAIVRFQTGAALWVAPTAIFFFAELLRDHSRATRRVARLATLASVALFLLVLSPWGTEFPLRALVAAYVLGALGWVFHLVLTRARAARAEPDRKRLSYVLAGGLIALVLAIGELIPGVELPAVMGHVAATFYVYFLYQSIVARRVIDMVELLGKAAVLAVLTLVLATVYVLLVWWVGSEHPGLWLFNTLIASFVILILYDQVRPWIEETTAKLMFRKGYELRQSVRRLVRALQTTIGSDEMVEQVLEALNRSGRASEVAAYLAAEGELSFELRGFRGEMPPQVLSLAKQPMLLSELRRDKRPILLEHLIERYEELPAPLTHADPTLERDLARTSEVIATMRDLHATVILPMLAEERIVGILTLGSEHAEAYSTEEIAALLSVADACAIVIENSQEYEKLRERDRLVAVGEVAAGIAHEIRNPLGAIKGAAQCIEPTTLPREAQEFLTVIVEEVDRLNGVLSQLLEYARPFRGNPVAVDVNDVVHATLRLFGHDTVPANVRIREDLALGLPKISVDPEQLKQVLLNLLLNAIQAMPQGGELSVTSGLSPPRPDELRHQSGLSESQQMVVLRVRDTGIGIKPEDLPRIFMPFFTTKPHGAGLGLAIAHRIVKNAGGHLEVWSRVGQGATLTLRFPPAAAAAKAQPGAEDQEAQVIN
ncbi:MAG: GAF domain-containing protein [Deltaproteobacteria bacterium]|nr:GAF domain-containing protein [Deltaproteobacteria bacterium]